MLRRALSLSAILALAGGILLAPPAAAFQEPNLAGFDGAGVDLTDIVRALPSDPVPTLAYGTAGQPVAALQIRLPIRTDATATGPGKQFATWQPGDDLTVTLPRGITFAAAPTVTASALTDLADLASNPAPVAASAVTADLVADNGDAVRLQAPQTSVTVTSDRSTVRIGFDTAQWAGSSADVTNAPWLNLTSARFTDAAAQPAPKPAVQPGFLLTLSGIQVSTTATATGGPVTATVAGDASNGLYGATGYSTYPAVAPAQCTVGTVGGIRNIGYVGGTTTLAYLPPVAVSVAPTTLGATDELQQLPAITAAGTWVAGGSYGISASVLDSAGASLGAVLFDFPTHTPAVRYLDAVVTSSAGLTVGSLTPSATTYVTTRTPSLSFTVTAVSTAAGDATGRQTVVVVGLRTAGYVPSGQLGARALPAGSRVQISLTPPASAVSAVNDTSTVGCLTRPGASRFSTVAAPTAPPAGAATVPVAETANRLGGLDRYDTAARIAMRFAGGGAHPVSAVILANGENAKQGFDALSATYLAGQVNSPVLLTAAGALPRATAQALRAVTNGSAAVAVYVMGKADSVSDAVVQQATAIVKAGATGAVTVTRIGGSNRYATSVQAAGAGTAGAASFAAGSPAYRTAILASGQVNADALAAGPLSAALHLPVLLTPADALPTEVLAAIKKLGIRQLFILGGIDRVTATVIAQARADGVVVAKRIAGANRFATSADLYAFARRPASTTAADGGGLRWSSGSTAYLANGITGFPDALAVGPLAAQADAPLLTNGPTSLDPSVAAFLKAQKLAAVTGLGQPATLALAVLTAAQQAGG